MRIAVVLAFALVLGATPAAGQAGSARSERRSIWSGDSAGFAVRWSSSDILVTRIGLKGPPVYSARAVAERDWKERASETSNMTCGEERDVEILSVVGPVMSVLDSTGGYCEGTAHPWAVSRYVAIDLEKSTAATVVGARLTDYFSERDVLAALLADRLVKASVSSSKRPSPTRLTELLTVTAEFPIRVGDCEFELDERSLSSFAFHHLQKDRVAIRLALPYRHEACRGLVAQLGLLLPLPERLKEALARANVRRAGFLMKDQDKVSRGLSTSFETSYGPAVGTPRVRAAHSTTTPFQNAT
jgi:hypothetical protein